VRSCGRGSGKGGRSYGAKAPPPSVCRGVLAPPQLDKVPNCTSSNKIEIL